VIYAKRKTQKYISHVILKGIGRDMRNKVIIQRTGIPFQENN
jgi:hypothetical protein